MKSRSLARPTHCTSSGISPPPGVAIDAHARPGGAVDPRAGQFKLFEKIVTLHPDARRPVAIGNCQAGYRTPMGAVLRPELRGARAFAPTFPGRPRAACFDISFHRSMPELARTHALPQDLLVPTDEELMIARHTLSLLRPEHGQDSA